MNELEWLKKELEGIWQSFPAFSISQRPLLKQVCQKYQVFFFYLILPGLRFLNIYPKYDTKIFHLPFLIS